MKSTSESIWFMIGLIIVIVVLIIIIVPIIKGKASIEIASAEADLKACCSNFCANNQNYRDTKCYSSGKEMGLLKLCEIARGVKGVAEQDKCKPCDCEVT